MRRVVAAAGSPLVLVLAAACGNDVDPELREYCDRISAFRCTANDRCCGVTRQRFESKDRCMKTLRPTCIRQTEPLFDDDRIRYRRQTFLEGIEAAASALDGDCRITMQERERNGALGGRSHRSSVFVGRRERGESCIDGDFDPNFPFVCKPDLECAVDTRDTDIDGVCVRPSAAGEPCRGRCRDGTFCNARGRCERPREAGAACSRDPACASRLCTEGTCAAPRAEDALCTEDPHCESGVCRAGRCAPHGRRYCLATTKPPSRP